MPPTSEPEKYSIDEMMDRLKNRPEEEPLQDGELVTRADGTQAIKVRKRKRRSHQPHKEILKKTRRARMIQVSGAVILLLTAAFAIGSAIVYANSAPIPRGSDPHDPRNHRCGGATGGIPGESIPRGRRAAGAEVAGGRHSARSDDSRGVGLDRTRLFLRQVDQRRGNQLCRSDAGLWVLPPSSWHPHPAPLGEKPSSIHFKRYATSRFNVRIGDPARPAASLLESEASFQLDNEKNRPQLLLNRGQIQLPGWPKIKMDRAHIEFRGGDIDIIGMRLLHESDNRGILELVGTVSPHATDRPSTLDVRMESFLLSGIAGPDLGELLVGRIDTQSKVKSNYLSFTPGSQADATLAVTFRNAPQFLVRTAGFPLPDPSGPHAG